MFLNSHDLKHGIQRLAATISRESRERRSRLIDPRFTIISSDCWGAEVYKDLGLPFQTPLIGTFLAVPCFVKLAANCEKIITSPLRFVDVSRYEFVEDLRRKRWFPTGLLGDDVEVQFLHYASVQEARDKWSRRLERVRIDRLLFKLSAGKDLCTEELLREFDSLQIKKLILSPFDHPNIPSAITIPDYEVDGKSMYAISLKYFDIVRWLNESSESIEQGNIFRG